jgi:alkaline phosphatase D
MSNPIDGNRRRFLLTSTAAAAATALGACSSGDSVSLSQPPQFPYGVASGDPLTDRVMLWTYAKYPDRNDAVPLTWQVATDTAFSNVVASGTAMATEDTGFTVKVDAKGLSAGTDYFYRFLSNASTLSTVGTTRTLPVGSVASIKFAVFSCSLYPEGFFNVYSAAAKSDAQFAIHVGDYIYEYGAGATQFGNEDAVALGRTAVPATDIISLADYRARYALYKSDVNLQALHARMPWITVWDDHEFANNAWVGGAENHNPATQGDWNARKAAAARAYHEWLPIRTPDPTNLLKIYRSFDFGNLFSLHMIDTRIEGRDRQYDNFGDADGGISRYLAGITPNAAGVIADASRHMMSTDQQNWLTAQLAASRATWQILGNQDIMAKMWIPLSVAQYFSGSNANPTGGAAAIQTYLTAKATRAVAGPAALTSAQADLLNPAKNIRLPYNLDSWDGYPMQRESILQAVKSLGKKLIVLSGDSHNGWFTNLTTLAGEKVGFEFAGSSVTSPGFESAGLGALASSLDGSALTAQLGSAAIGTGLGLIDDLNYADTIRRGYLMMTVTPASIKGEYIYVSTVKSTTFTTSVGRTVTVPVTGAVTYA